MDNQPLEIFLAVTALLFGGVIGSFLNVCICRLPEGKSVVRPGSRCPRCENPIAWYDNIPVFSWLMLNAKCRHCGEPISWQYPLVEALNAVLFFLVYWRFGLVPATPIYMILVSSLIVVTFVDFATWTIPNEITLPGIVIGLICSVVAMFYPASGLRLEPLYAGVFDALPGVVLGFGVLYLLDKATLLILKKPGMGMGDAKLLAMFGAFVGWKGVLLIIVLASFLGSVIGIIQVLIRKHRGAGQEDHYLQFGPFLSVAGLIIILYGPALLNAYLSFIRGSAI